MTKNYESALCLAILFKLMADMKPENTHLWWVDYLFCAIFLVVAAVRFFREHK